MTPASSLAPFLENAVLEPVFFQIYDVFFITVFSVAVLP